MKKQKPIPSETTSQPIEATSKDIKKSKSRWKFRLVVILLIAIIGTGIYRNLQMKNQQPEHVSANALFSDKKNPAPIIKPIKIGMEKTDVLPVENEIKPDVVEEQKTIESIEEKINQDQIIQKEIAVEAAHKNIEFKAFDALLFRDHFISEAPCGEDFRKLILSEKKSKTINTVIKTTSSFCLTTNNVYNELRLSFRAAKKKALIALYKQDESPWRARLKIIMAHIIKVRNLNPTEETTVDTIDRAHNALEGKNIALTVEMIGKLPSDLQPYFNDFLSRTKDYIEAKAALDELVLSFTKGGH